MSFFNDIKTRQIQRRGNAFIKKLENKNDIEAKQLYLDNKEFHNNEIVLSYIFFHFPSLISLLPLDFQKTMINSNITSFKEGSPEAKKALVSDWLSDNKFFMNVKQIDLDNEEYENYICMYFNQIDDVSKLYMDDLYTVINILYKHDKRMTENVIETIKDKLTERQWEFILKVDPMFIKYASEQIQNNYSEKEEYSNYISGKAKDNYIKSQLEKIKEDNSLLNNVSIDIQKEYILNNPYVINNLEDDKLIELLKYDIDLIRYVNLNKLKNNEIIYNILENVSNKKIEEIINVFIEKGLFNAKTKLYKYDNKSNNLNYQYTKRLIRLIQSLSFEQIISLINIDVNYVLPYIVPLYNDKDERDYKESEALEANSRCLNLFKEYYNEEIYNKYYKVVNKIYNEFISNVDKNEFTSDYDSIFDLFKLLFNKKIIENNNPEKISVFVGISLLYKGKDNNDSKNASIKLLNELLTSSYKKEININTDIYNINSLELFDDKFSFINKELLFNNNCLISSLLYIVKSKDIELFKNYYKILINIYGEKIETLLFSIENFNYYKDILNDVNNKDLNDEEINNLVRLLSSNKNYLNIKSKDELLSYDLNILKKLISDFTENSDEIIRKNLVCNYLFNKPFDINGTNLDYMPTIKNYLDICSSEVLKEISDFNIVELDLFNMIKLMFNINDSELLISYIESTMNEKLNINIVSIINLFNKIEKNKMEIINKQVVTLDDIELLYESDKNAVNKRNENGVDIYKFNNQDFKVLCSFSNDGYHYDVKYLSEIDKNYYGYNMLIDNNFILSSDNDKTILKYRKDKIINKIKPDYIIVKNGINSDIIKVASDNNLKIIEAGDMYE